MDAGQIAEYLLAAPEHRACVTAYRRVEARPTELAEFPPQFTRIDRLSTRIVPGSPSCAGTGPVCNILHILPRKRVTVPGHGLNARTRL